MESKITVPPENEPAPEKVKIGKINRMRLRCFTKEEARRYDTQLYETHGYDMDQYPPVVMGLIIPLNIETNREAKGNALKFGEFAVQDYNNKQEAEGGGVMLEFVKPLKINIQGAAGFNYYITFEAKDVGAPDDQSRIYQAKVFDGITVTKVLHFRLKPTGPGNSGN